MQIVVNQALCAGHARCHAMEPDLFPIDDLGHVAVTSPDVPDDLVGRARRAIVACPERALSLAE